MVNKTSLLSLWRRHLCTVGCLYSNHNHIFSYHQTGKTFHSQFSQVCSIPFFAVTRMIQDTLLCEWLMDDMWGGHVGQPFWLMPTGPRYFAGILGPAKTAVQNQSCPKMLSVVLFVTKACIRRLPPQHISQWYTFPYQNEWISKFWMTLKTLLEIEHLLIMIRCSISNTVFNNHLHKRSQKAYPCSKLLTLYVNILCKILPFPLLCHANYLCHTPWGWQDDLNVSCARVYRMMWLFPAVFPIPVLQVKRWM